MRDMILLSVIIPVYNVEPYLYTCLESVCGQTYKRLEIILVDDGSTDESGAICDLYAQKDNRIKVIHKTNAGLISARKTGIFEATGDYISHIDADDWVDRNMFEVMVNEIVKYGTDIVTSGMIREYEDKGIITHDLIPEGFYDKKGKEEKVLPTMMYTGNFYECGINPHITNKIFRADLARRANEQVMEENTVGEDSIQVYPAVFWADSISIIHTPFYHYRCREGSNVTKKRDLSKCVRQYVYMREVFENRKYLKDQLNYLILFFMMIKSDREVRWNLIEETFKNINKTDRIILCGAGKFGTLLKESLDDYKVIAWIDQIKNEKKGIDSFDLLNELNENDYEKIIIGAVNYDMIASIKNNLLKYGIPDEKIVSFAELSISTKRLEEILGI